MECASANDEIPASHLENGVASKDMVCPALFVSVSKRQTGIRSLVMAEQIVNPLCQVEVEVANGKLRYTDYPTGTCT